MRFVFIVTLILIGSTLLIVRYPTEASSALKSVNQAISNRVEAVFYDKRIVFKGLNVLRSEDLKSLLPLNRNNIWWYTQKEDIAATLKGEPLIEDVHVTGCDDETYFSWGCFQIDVSERRPSYIALSGDKAWLVAEDGAFIAPISKSSQNANPTISKIAAQAANAVKIRGLFSARYSPEVINAKLKVVSETIEIIKQEVGLEVEEISLLKGGELELGFKDHSFSSVLEFGEGDVERIRDQAKRLNKVLIDNRTRLGDIENVDLAFHKMAVVRFKQVQSKE